MRVFWHFKLVERLTVGERAIGLDLIGPDEARAEVLLNELSTVRILLAQLEKDRSLQAKDVEKIFRLAMEHAGNYQMESSSETHATPTPSAVTELLSD